MIALTHCDRVVLHLLQYQGRGDCYCRPRECTYDGMAAPLGITRAHLSVNMASKLNAGLFEHRLAHVPGSKAKLIAWNLSPAGEERARSLLSLLGAEKADIPRILASSVDEAMRRKASLHDHLKRISSRITDAEGVLVKLKAEVGVLEYQLANKSIETKE